MGVIWNDDPPPIPDNLIISKDRQITVPAWDLFVACSHALESLDVEILPFTPAHKIIFRLLGQIDQRILEPFRSAYPAEYFEE